MPRSLELPNVRTVQEALRELVSKGCADAVTLRYTSEDTIWGEIGISASPWYMTPFIIDKLKELFDLSAVDDTGAPSNAKSYPPYYSVEELAKIKGDSRAFIKKKHPLDAEPDEREQKIMTVDVAANTGEKSLIIYSGDHDVARLVFDADGEPDIEPYPSSYIHTGAARLHPAFVEDMEEAPRKAFVKEWLQGLLPGEAVIKDMGERLSRPIDALYDKARLLGHCIAGNVKLHYPLYRFCEGHDCMLSLPSKPEYSSVFPGQESGFAATYVPNIGLYTQGFWLPDTHYVIPATEKNKDALIARLYALRVAKLIDIPAVDAVWHEQDGKEYLVMSRYDMRNGMEIWRGRWAGDTEILKEADKERLLLQQALNALIFGMEPQSDFDLYEVVPTCYRREEMSWENSNKGDDTANIRLAPYIGVTMPFNSKPELIPDSATANMLLSHPGFELAQQTLLLEYPELSWSLAQFDIQRPAASH